MAGSVKDSIDIRASALEIFEVATDLDSYPDWNEDIKRVEVKQRDDENRPVEVWMEVDVKLKLVGYTIEYDYSAAPGFFSWSLVEGDVKELEGSYRFDEFDDVTEVTYEMRVDPGFPIPGLLKRQAERRVARGALENLKQRVEGMRS
jgi:uncharacterized membrane protein